MIAVEERYVHFGMIQVKRFDQGTSINVSILDRGLGKFKAKIEIVDTFPNPKGGLRYVRTPQGEVEATDAKRLAPAIVSAIKGVIKTRTRRFSSPSRNFVWNFGNVKGLTNKACFEALQTFYMGG